MSLPSGISKQMTRQYQDYLGHNRRGDDAGWGPSGPAETGSTRINDLAQLLANKGLLNTAAAQIAADADLGGGTRIGNAQRKDRLAQGAMKDRDFANRSLGGSRTYYRGPQRAGSTGKSGAGMGGGDFWRRVLEQRRWVQRDVESKARMDEEKEMERFRASLRNQELAQRMSVLARLLPGGNARRTTDTATHEELVNVAGRPEKRSLSSSQTKDNSMEILQQIMRMI